MQILKFGGSSVADARNIEKVIRIIQEAVSQDRTAVVCSAVSGATDALLEIGQTAGNGDETYLRLISALEEKHARIIEELFSSGDAEGIRETAALLFRELRDICKGVFLLKEMTGPSRDHIISFGEILSTRILSARLSSLNVSHLWKDSRELVKTESVAGKNSILQQTTLRNIGRFLSGSGSRLFILPGFIASDLEGRTTTLGRGGSDYTASIIAVGAQARKLEIWTDVCGMMTADPRIVPQARPIRHISYKEALELSHFGAKVVYPPTIQPVVAQGIPIYVKNTFLPDDPGTLIERNPPLGEGKLRGISSSDKIALLSMEGSGMVGIPGYSSRLFDVLAQHRVNIILITQASSVHTMCIAIPEADAETARKAADEVFAYEISLGKVEPLKVETGFSIISLVGDDMQNQSGASGKMFEALGREGIGIRAIAQGSSEKNVSAVLHTRDVQEAIRAIHAEFFSGTADRVNLFIAGCGTVGKALADMIFSRREAIAAATGKNLVICGLGNSRKYLFSKNGLGPDSDLEQGKDNAAGHSVSRTHNNGSRFLEEIIAGGLGNPVFVDCTASREIASCYADLFHRRIAVVTCNKIANSRSYAAYEGLFSAALQEKTAYKYGTTVCAALPVLETIRQLVHAGDRITKMEGVLSGTLNWLLSRYCAKVPFSALVQEAAEKGYAEPDPRTDLSGGDVMRKFLIATREAGLKTEREAVAFEGFIPNEILAPEKTAFREYADEFYARLLAWEPQLQHSYAAAAAKGARLRFTAVWDPSGSRIGLAEVQEGHPFYTLEGTDNAVVITSDSYPAGILLKGAGAGACQTAGGLLNDILSL